MRGRPHFRRNRQPEFDEPEFDLEAIAANAVTNFRQRLHEDPDFKAQLVASLRIAFADDPESIDESKKHTETYGDVIDVPVSDKLHALRGDSFRSIVSLIGAIVEPGDYGWSEMSPDQALDEIRHTVGHLANQAYIRGQDEPPMQLQQGALGIYYEGLGTVVVWERVRGVEGQLDQIIEQPPELGGGEV